MSTTPSADGGHDDETVASARRAGRGSAETDAAPSGADDDTLASARGGAETQRATEEHRRRRLAAPAEPARPESPRRTATTGIPGDSSYRPRQPGPAVAREPRAERRVVDLGPLASPRPRVRRRLPIAAVAAAGIVVLLLGAAGIAILLAPH